MGRWAKEGGVSAYYNEFDPHAAQWLRNLIKAGLIAPGDVDERSISDVGADDLAGYRQCHFFAGIGIWSHALRLAGWADDREVWTGSCPCQPFSSAGKGKGFNDERHLWPVWADLIRKRRPPVVFGEQVASKDGLTWLDLVHADMEDAGYAIGAGDICAAGVGAPHIRQRLWFVADAERGAAEPDRRDMGSTAREVEGREDERQRVRAESWAGVDAGRLADAACIGRDEGRERLAAQGVHGVAGNGAAGGMGDNDNARLEGLGRGHQAASGRHGAVRSVATAGESCGMEHAGSIGRKWRETPAPGHDDDRTASEWAQGEHGAGVASAHRIHQHRPGPTNGHWRAADWLLCRDGKWRPVEPGTFPLVDGAAFRLDSGSAFEGKTRAGLLKGFGNGIVPQVAAQIVEAFMEYRP